MALSAAVGLAEAQTGGYALRFDGTTDLVRLQPTASMMAPTWPTTKTVSLWINPTGTPFCSGTDPVTCDVIFGDRPRSWGISRGVLSGQDRIWIWNFDGSVDRIGVEYTPGVWTQITLVHQNNVLSAYKDGVLVASIASRATLTVPGQTLYVGGIIGNATQNWTFEGQIDEVQIWNVARTDSEIAASMFGPLTGQETGLAAYYRMTNGSGTTLTDDSGHNFTGSLLDGGSGVPANGPIVWESPGVFSGPIVINTPPTADPQAVATAEDTAAAITLTGSDVDGNPLTFRVTVPPTSGALTGTAPNLTYTPATNFHGTDTFVFVANDGRVDSTPATVSLTVTAVDDLPVAFDDTASTSKGTPILIDVLHNDVDVDGGPLAILSVGIPQHGSVVMSGDSLTYTPNPDFVGTDTFEYTVSDPNGSVASALVTVSVTSSDSAGFALRFDGNNDWVRLGTAATMMAPGWQSTKTISLWVKPTGSASCEYQVPSHCDLIFGDYPQWWGITRGTIGGLDRIWIWNFDGRERWVGIPYTPGQWVHIAMVHQGGIMSAYKNGALVGSVASGATRQPSTGAHPYLQLGGAIANATRRWMFEGEIDEVQIWSVARTPAELALDVLGPLSGPQTGLSAYYRMTDAAGTSLTDDSGNGWTGSLRDGNSVVPPDVPIAWVVSGAFVVP